MLETSATNTNKPTKEYRARVWVKLTDDMLPEPVLSKAEVEALLKKALQAGASDSPIVSVAVDDPRTTTKKRY